MAIAALPQETFRLLGSSKVITTPVSLVKELVENAIDAKATSITIRISPNTIDKVEVSDNGEGISPNDFPLLGRPSHTSKLRRYEELPSVARKTLGFRGEALASANSLADITITTRTPQDLIAHLVTLRRDVGGVREQFSAARVNGTTVHATNLFDRCPVRKGIAIKASSKCITDIKGMLQSYALARPYLKISFKVIGDERSSWSFIPEKDAEPLGAVRQCLGRSVAIECQCECLTTKPAGNTAGSFILEAILPLPYADLSKICGKGAFISVDSRPVTSARGTMKKVITLFKEVFKESLGHGIAKKTLAAPFIRINIVCPPQAYDPNVSSSKDEVLFYDEGPILDMFKQLFSVVYRGPVANERGSITPDIYLENGVHSKKRMSGLSPDGDDTEPGRESRGSGVFEPLTQTKEPLRRSWKPSEFKILDVENTWEVDMAKSYEDNDETIDGHSSTREVDVISALSFCSQESRPKAGSNMCTSNSLNPWTIARFTGTPKDKRPAQQDSGDEDLFSPESQQSPCVDAVLPLKSGLVQQYLHTPHIRRNSKERLQGNVQPSAQELHPPSMVRKPRGPQRAGLPSSPRELMLPRTQRKTPPPRKIQSPELHHQKFIAPSASSRTDVDYAGFSYQPNGSIFHVSSEAEQDSGRIGRSSHEVGRNIRQVSCRDLPRPRPLEVITLGMETYTTVCKSPVSCDQIKKSMTKMLAFDEYIKSGVYDNRSVAFVVNQDDDWLQNQISCLHNSWVRGQSVGQ